MHQKILLQGEVSKGLFPSERAVVIDTRSGPMSLLADEQSICRMGNQDYLIVQLMDEGNGFVLVLLPNEVVGGGRRSPSAAIRSKGFQRTPSRRWMVLSNTAIFKALNDGQPVLDPEPTPRSPSLDQPDSPFDRTSVDLTLGGMIHLPKQDVGVNIDFRSGTVANTLSAFFDPQDVDPIQGFRLERGIFILGQTRERVGLTHPRDLPIAVMDQPVLAGRVEGKSSWARFGLIVHFTAPTIHAGFGPAPIALEIMNFGPAPIMLVPGMRICQLIVEEVVGVPDERSGQFDQQDSARG